MSSKTDDAPVLVTLAQLSRLLGVTPRTAARWYERDPTFPRARDMPGGRRRWVREEVLAYLRKQRS